MTLWGYSDQDKKTTLPEKLAGAIAEYAYRFGRPPRTCYVRPDLVAELAGSEIEVKGLDVGQAGYFLCELPS